MGDLLIVTTIRKMRVLVACEFSGIIREAFNRKGHDAWSCDLLESEIPGNHIKGDVLRYIRDGWDLMIAHPPCTYTAVSGNRWHHDSPLRERGYIFFMKLMQAPIDKICVEHPVSIISSRYRQPNQYIQPWMFGHGEIKATGLWLKNLPDLKPTNIVKGRQPRVHHESPGPDRWKNRSRTLPGIADAMADQWSCT